MNTIIEKIRAEVNRLLNDKSTPHTGKWYEGYLTALRKMSSSIYHLEKEEKPTTAEGLEKEIQNQIYNHFFDLNGIAITGTTAYATVEDMVYIAKLFYELGKEEKPNDQEQPICEELGREMDRFFTSEEYEEAEKAGFGETQTARHFAQWQREQMMKGALECEVTETRGISSVWIKTKQFKPGQKVKIIIVKED